MIDDLAKFRVLDELGERGRETFAEFLEPKMLSEGFILFQQGQEASDLLLIRSGRITLKRGGDEVGRLGRGEMLGGVSLVLIGKHECEASAEEECELLSLSRESYLRLRADHPQAALDLQEGILRSFAGATRGLLPRLSG